MLQREEWLATHTHRTRPAQARELAAKVRESHVRLGVVLSVRNDARSLGKHLLALSYGWPGGDSPWCEIAAVDLGSTDASVEIARSQDARLLGGPERFLPGDAPAEGLALRRATEQLGCDIVMTVPAGLRRIDWEQASGLVLSLIEHPAAVLAIGFQDVPPPSSSLALRPLLSALEPDLSLVVDPTCPLLAVRSAAVRELPLALTQGYEPALLLEAWKRHDLDGLCQAPVGTLLWQDGGVRHEEHATFRSMLALLEAAHRQEILDKATPFGHLFSTLSQEEDGVRVHAGLQLFRWSVPESQA
jgi:hypothetical protein